VRAGYYAHGRAGFLPNLRSLAWALLRHELEYIVIHRPAELGPGMPHADLDRRCWCRPHVVTFEDLRDMESLAIRIMAEQKAN
jgi:hypothetical protein